MKRKLISFEAFKNLEEGSLTRSEQELINAEDVLGKTLGVDVELHCYGESDVTYKTSDDTYIHAIYKLEDDQVILENIQELVIDNESAKANSRNAISEMVDALLDNNKQKANTKFEEYFLMPNVRRELTEGYKAIVTTSKPTGKRSKKYRIKWPHAEVMAGVRTRARRAAMIPDSIKRELKRKAKQAKKKLGKTSNKRWGVHTRIKKTMKEWSKLAENVFGYVDYKNYGHVISESVVKNDNNGNVVALAIPNIQKRNEGKVLSFNWKTLDTEVKVLRGKAKRVNEDQSFVKAIAELKRYNNISDNANLEECLENIVAKWPSVLYLTQDELSANIAEALEIANVNNYDDSVCNFMAEAILRTAHHAYTNRVSKIARLAGHSNDVTSECKTCKDSYVEFQNIAVDFFDKLDESDSIDLKVFSDLYKALHEMNKAATQIGDEVAKVETASFMSECESVLNRNSAPSLELAENIADYISELVEANLDRSGEWKDMDVHTSVGGDHPMNAWAARQTDAVPSKFNGGDEYGLDHSPVSDGKSFGGEEEMMGDALGNDSGDNTWPSLNNPYIPDAFEFTMKGEKGADKDDDELGTYQDSDTWPNLKNTLSPESKRPVINQ